MKLMSAAVMVLAAILLGVAPWFWILPTPPVHSAVNESLAWMGWMLVCAWALSPGSEGGEASAPKQWPRWTQLPMVSLGLVAFMGVADAVSGRTPYPSVAIYTAAYVVAAMLCFGAGARLTAVPQRATAVVDCIVIAWVLGALACVALGGYQFVRPEGEYPWVAALSSAGRVYANLRQPNHLATMLAMGWVCVLWLSLQRRLVSPVLMVLVSAFLLTGMAMTGSRTGAVTVLFTSAVFVALFWRRGAWRWLGLVFPLLYAMAWLGLAWLNQTGLYSVFGVERLEQLKAGAEATGARWTAWLTMFDMVRAYPWTGVGTGRFGFFFILGDWSHPATLQFGNAHNLVLHLTVEYGIPVALSVLGGLAVFVVIRWRARSLDDPLWVAWLLPVPVLCHSMFEFPLWYSYFLLPTAFAFGVLAGGVRPHVRDRLGVRVVTRWHWLALLWLLMPPLALWSMYGTRAMYWPDATPLPQRIQLAQDSFLFRQQADHALLASAPPDLVMEANLGPVFRAVAEVLIDPTLLRNWSMHSAANSQIGQARRMAYAVKLLSPEYFETWRQQVLRSNDPPLAEFRQYMRDPVPVRWPIEQILSTTPVIEGR